MYLKIRLEISSCTPR